MCKVLNFTGLLKKIEIFKAWILLLCGKVVFSLIHSTQLPLTVFQEEDYKKITVENNDILTFQIFFAFTIVFPLELETRLYYLTYTGGL